MRILPKRKPEVGYSILCYAKPKKPRFVDVRKLYLKPQVFWQCRQISYGLSKEDMTDGMCVGFCEHAFREFSGKIPDKTRFILATVRDVPNQPDLMKLEFVAHPDGIPWMMCGKEPYSRFCVPADPNYLSFEGRMMLQRQRAK